MALSFGFIVSEIVITGFESCFCCRLDKVDTSMDPEFMNDYDFFCKIQTYFKDIKYVLDSDKSALKAYLKNLQTGIIPAFKKFHLKLKEHKPVCHVVDESLQLCQFLVLNGLFFSFSAHITVSFDAANQVKI